MEKKFKIQEASDMTLVNIVNSTEGLTWKINHDVSHGRMSKKSVDDTLKDLKNTRDEAIVELKKRTNISDYDGLRQYIQKKLKEQGKMWDNQWKELSQEGAVFTFKEENPYVFETVRKYLPVIGMMGPK